MKGLWEIKFIVRTDDPHTVCEQIEHYTKDTLDIERYGFQYHEIISPEKWEGQDE